MKPHKDNANALPALLRAESGVDTLETNSLCCAAAGIIAPSSATAEALIPHEKLRGAALADATLNAQKRPLAQLAVGYNHPIASAVKTQFGLDFTGEIRVDLFAGGGGATMGQEMGTGMPVDIAINHNPDAISMHKRNHPSAEHYITDVYDVCPRLATRGRPVAHLHASPECTHHSLAAGGQARSTTSRSQSWVIQKWGGQVCPRMITMENVVQILQWGPLIAKRCSKTGRVVRRDMTVAVAGERVPVQDQYLVPDPKRKGRTWLRFENNLRSMGYDLMYGKLKACDFGAATTRERLFLIARRDGQPLRWPEPTHFKNPGKGQSAYRTAASCIDWSIPCPSIFLTKEEGRAAGVKRPLVNNTMERLRKGAKRYVIEHKNPFIVSVNHRGNDLARCQSVEDPAKTITGAQGFALVTPQLAPFITEHANGSSQRNMPVDDPLRTICSGVKGGHFALAVAYVAQHNGGYNVTPGHHPKQPLTAITTTGSQQQIVTAHLSTLRKNCVGRAMDELVPTITAGAGHHALVEYKLAPEVEAGAMRVAAFLMGYYGSDNTYDLRDPAATITTRDRLALVTVTIKGTPYVIVDIGMRMLTPRELYRAQGFPDNYVIDRGHDGRKFSNRTQVLMVGNSVSPWPMMALVRSNRDKKKQQLYGGGRMNTLFLLMAQYNGKAVIPLNRICADYMNLTVEKFKQKQFNGEIDIPITRLGANSQKASLGIHIKDLAEYIDRQRAKALEEHKKIIGGEY